MDSNLFLFQVKFKVSLYVCMYVYMYVCMYVFYFQKKSLFLRKYFYDPNSLLIGSQGKKRKLIFAKHLNFYFTQVFIFFFFLKKFCDS